MSISALPAQAVNAAAQTQQTAPPPKPAAQTTSQAAAPQDKVTISPQAQQALAANSKPAASGDVDHDGDNH
jgi:hypothetical protein